MVARRSASFSRRCGDRNHSWTWNNEEGISRRRDPNDDRFTGIFSKEDSVRKAVGKTKGKRRDATRRDATQWYAESGIKEERRRRDSGSREKQEGQEKARISITESNVSSLKQDGGKENVTKSTD